MGKWTEEIGRELASLIKVLSNEKQKEKEEQNRGQNKEQNREQNGGHLTIREIGLPRLMLMLIAGLVLLILTFPNIFSQTGDTKTPVSKTRVESEQKEMEKEEVSDLNTYVENAELRLKELLKQVEGVGNVEVMITIKASGEKIPLKDMPYEKSSSSEESAGTKRAEEGERTEEGTILMENSDGTTQPYVIKETVPEIEGVVVLAEGGGNSEIKKEIMEAVQALFNIKAHKIKVMKMN